MPASEWVDPLNGANPDEGRCDKGLEDKLRRWMTANGHYLLDDIDGWVVCQSYDEKLDRHVSLTWDAYPTELMAMEEAHRLSEV